MSSSRHQEPCHFVHLVVAAAEFLFPLPPAEKVLVAGEEQLRFQLRRVHLLEVGEGLWHFLVVVVVH